MRYLLTVASVAALLLAGCTGPAPDDDTRPADGGSPGLAPGSVETDADARPIPEGWNLSAHTINQGTRPVDYRQGCGHEWDWEIVDPDEEPVPMAGATCLGFSEAELGPGETVDFAFHWDETRWNDTAGDYERVEPGTYVFRIAFLYDDGERSQAEAFVTVE